MGKGKYYHNLLTETKERESNPPRVSGMSYLYSDL